MVLNPNKLNPRKLDEIDDDEIRVLGDSECDSFSFESLENHCCFAKKENTDEVRLPIVRPVEQRKRPIWLWIAIGIIVVGIVIAIIALALSSNEEDDIIADNAQVEAITAYTPKSVEIPEQPIVESKPAYTIVSDTIVDGNRLRIFAPQNATATLHIGAINKADSSIVFISQAADIRADNKEIVGAFVLKGEPRGRGKSKAGFCAIIDGNITLGLAESTPLFEEATEKDGYFFRQYPLVFEGQPISNHLKGRSYRRALAEQNGKICVIGSLDRLSLNEFSQTLIALGVKNAITLVGGQTYGWAVEADSSRVEFGNENANMHPNTSYIIWRKN